MYYSNMKSVDISKCILCHDAVCTKACPATVSYTHLDFLTIYRNDGDGSIKGCQYQEVGNKKQYKLFIPDFLNGFHMNTTPFLTKTSGNCH